MKNLLLLLAFLPLLSIAQKKMTQKEYIEKYKSEALKDMKLSGVPAAITLAQGVLESESGNSPLALGSNNHFGIKCHKEWTGPTYHHDDDAKQECFRKYNSVLDSYEDHSNFLRTRSRYAFLFEIPKDDYKAWAYGLKKAGYATNPRYPELLIKIIEDHNLQSIHKEELVDQEPVMASQDKTAPKKISAFPEKLKILTPIDVNERVMNNNKVRFVIVRPGDTYLTIANEFEIGLWQIFKYNEIDKNTPLNIGQKIYLEPKRRNASDKSHVVKPGESLHDIAQQYGIKLKHLYKLNQLAENNEIKEGQQLKLQ